ncbi:flagellar filament capping protein FliD [Endozoicomonadaceae bacterium StTr2]
MSSVGLGTGLNIDQMVKTMVQSDLKPKQTQLQRKENELNTEIQAISILEKSLKTFFDAIKPLQEPESFGSMKVSYGTDAKDYFSVTTDEGVNPGTYNLQVNQLATAEKQTFATIAPAPGSDDPPKVAAGTYTITQNGKSFEFELTEDTKLDKVVEKINNHSDNTGVKANLVNAKDGAYLALTSSKTGEANGFTVKKDGTDLTPAKKDAAKDAVFFLDGIEITSKDNKVEDAIPGMTINLKDVDTTKAYRFTVEADTGKMTKSIEAFVDAYNALIKDVGKLTKSVVGQPRPPLAGDTMVTNLQRQLRTGMSSFNSPLGSATLKKLTDLGITTNLNGELKLDKADLKKALEDNPDDVAAIFTGEKGLFSEMQDVMEVYLGKSSSDSSDDKSGDSSKGLIEKRVDSLKDELKDIKDDWKGLSERQKQLDKRYRSQLVKLDLAVSKMNQTMQSMNSLNVVPS